MARNREVFENAMRDGASAAWEQDWEKAIAAYQRALAEYPDDATVLSSLGRAHLNAGQYEEALDAYQRASQITPGDPALYEHIGEAQEKLGHDKQAAQAYQKAAEYYARHNQHQPAVDRWKDAIRVWPDSLPAHAKLLQYYQAQGQAQQAIEESLAVARIYEKRGHKDYAIKACQHALKLSPHDPEIQAYLDQLRYKKTSPAPEIDEEIPAAEADLMAAMQQPLDATTLNFETMERIEEEKEVEDRGNPVEITRQKALSDLAESFFEDEIPAPSDAAPPSLSKAEIDTLLGQAIDFQTRGKVIEAIEAYEKVLDANAPQAAVHFNLGLLYQEKLRFEDAIEQFEAAITHPDYVLGSHFALGECQRARGRIDEALEHFIEVLKIVDLSTVQREQADDLIQLYESLADSYLVKGEQEQALEFTNSLVKFLSDKGWEDKVAKARQRLDVLTQEGPALSLAEVLTIPNSEHVMESISLSQEYVKRSMHYTALEECAYALDYAPNFLPIHQQMAQILVSMGKIEQAIAKFVVTADTYGIRGNIASAMSMYQRALKLTPMDTHVRTKLIDLLTSHGEIDKALENYLILADSHYHMAQMDKSRDIYLEALRLAPRGTPEKRWEVRILHKIGDIDMQLVNWKNAIEVYERIRELAPDDERARLTLMDLYYRFGRSEAAIIELDKLLQIYKEDQKSERIFTILENAVRDKPDNIPLRTRLAQAHLDAGNVNAALEHLDKLGDMQIEAGRVEDAKATIRVIIALKPPNVEAYQQVFDQLG
ncbi:MAG TPA: tetratricopeptide repeat protein [Chloroflexi bacterium]|nr:tetratricopeptide repeat protein [Chloroflexota bacterium]